MSNKTKIKKIAELIKKEGLKPSDCIYHTWRDCLNKAKKPAGSIRILVKKNSSIAHCEYVCPECGNYEYLKTEWKRPFSVKCKKCGFLIRVPKLKDQIKKEKKAEDEAQEESK